MLHCRKDYNARVQDSEERIPADEPVFLLRAQDSLAAGLVMRWAKQYLAAGGDPVVAMAVQEHANKMAAWKPKKNPDTPVHLLQDKILSQVPSMAPPPTTAPGGSISQG